MQGGEGFMLVETKVEECPARQLLSQAFLLAPSPLGCVHPRFGPQELTPLTAEICQPCQPHPSQLVTSNFAASKLEGW